MPNSKLTQKQFELAHWKISMIRKAMLSTEEEKNLAEAAETIINKEFDNYDASDFVRYLVEIQKRPAWTKEDFTKLERENLKKLIEKYTKL